MAQTISEMIAQGKDVTQTLSETEKADLEKFEAVIGKGLNTFLEVGQALAEIRDRRLYRETHKTFERYCKTTWDLSKTHANRQISGYETFILLESKMAPIGAEPDQTETILPINEAQTRPLTKLKNPDDQVKAWEIVLDKLNQNPKTKLTAALINKVVKEVKGETAKEKIRQIKQEVPKTSLLSRQFKNQHQVLLDIVVEAKNNGWTDNKQSEVVKWLQALVTVAKSDD